MTEVFSLQIVLLDFWLFPPSKSDEVEAGGGEVSEEVLVMPTLDF